MDFLADEFLNFDATLWGQAGIPAIPPVEQLQEEPFNLDLMLAAHLDALPAPGEPDSGEPPAKRARQDAGTDSNCDSDSDSSASSPSSTAYLVPSPEGDTYVIAKDDGTSHVKKGKTQFKPLRDIKDDEELLCAQLALKRVCEQPSYMPVNGPHGAQSRRLMARHSSDSVVPRTYTAALGGNFNYRGFKAYTETSKVKENTKKHRRDRQTRLCKSRREELANLLLTAINFYQQRRVAEQAEEIRRLQDQIAFLKSRVASSGHELLDDLVIDFDSAGDLTCLL